MATRLEETFAVPGVPPQRCFDYIADPANGADWASFAREVTADGEPGVGRRVHAHVGFLGATFAVPSTVTVWDEPHAYVLASTTPFRGAIGASLAASGDGTAVTAHIEVDTGRYFPVPGLVLRRALQRQFDRDVGALRTHLRGLA